MIKYIDTYEPAFLLDKNGIEKTAEEKKDEVAKDILDFAKGLKPDKDKKLYVHKVLMGDGEAWGSNKNGDDFPKEDLYADNPSYGYKTLLDAGIYTKHRNKDKSKTLGRIVISVVNPKMRRVELVEELDRELCKEHDKDFGVYDRLINGETLFSSMGARVPYDVCSECGNRAPTRAQYCNHLLYMMNQILPSGNRVRAINPHPCLFDDSYVGVPAFTPAFTLNIFKMESDIPKHLSGAKKDLDSHEKTAGKRVIREVNYQGLPIAIEVEKGSFRFRKFYKTLMHCHYGYIKGTEGQDGEEIDVYFTEKPSDKVYQIKQLKKNGEFDEYKYILGVDSKDEAKKVYTDHMPQSFFGGAGEIPFKQFKELISKEEKLAEKKEGTMIKRVPTLSDDLLKKVKFK